ncbi:MAG: hypothetical protein P8Y71_29330 [Pseudolabrys sp.]
MHILKREHHGFFRCRPALAAGSVHDARADHQFGQLGIGEFARRAVEDLDFALTQNG